MKIVAARTGCFSVAMESDDMQLQWWCQDVNTARSFSGQYKVVRHVSLSHDHLVTPELELLYTCCK